MIRTAIVGCGGIARVHAESVASMKEHRLTAFADSKKERAEEFARTYGGNAYSSLEEMLSKEKIDVLHVCTPHYLHVPMSIQALEKGIHVYQEKPAAISPEQYQELCRAVKKSDARLAISYQNRYNTCMQKAKELLTSGKAGKILGGRAFVTWNRAESYYTESDWRGKLATEGGGCLINQSIHTLDLLAQLLGRPVKVEAEILNHRLKDVIEVEDTVEAYLTFETTSGECHGNFYATNSYCTDSTPLIEITAEQMTLRMEDPDLTIYYPDGSREKLDFNENEEFFGKRYWGNGHKRAIKDFYEAIEQGRECRIELKNTDESNRLMFAVYHAARENKSKFHIRLATYSDLPTILDIYAHAREFQKQTGNPNQWKNGYPYRDVLEDDIAADNLYVCMADGKIVGVFAFILGEDATYRKIWDGEWISNEPYGTIHRIASDGSVRGIATFCFAWAYEKSGENLRIDTHEDNTVMQHLLAKNGFSYCGKILTDDGTERLAYQKCKKN